MTGLSLHRQLQTLLEEKLLPAARRPAPLILLEAPVAAAEDDGLKIVSTPAKALPRAKPNRSHITLYSWPDHLLNSLRVPYLAFVFEGEADITTALTSEQAKNHVASANAGGLLPFGRQTVSVREPAFFLVPPGAPVSYGPRVHWERPDPQLAYSRIFWIHLVPSGVFCHTCTSSKGNHRTHPFVFVADEKIPLLADLLLTETARREERPTELACALLLSLLLKISRAFERERFTVLTTGEEIESAAALQPRPVNNSRAKASAPEGSVVVRRAVHFIDDNLNQVLDPAAIASQSYVSASHLNRLFHAELKVPVMEYVTSRRLSKARTLLAETAIPVSEVAVLCGYPNASHFSQLFTRHQRCSPRAFRENHQAPPQDAADTLAPR